MASRTSEYAEKGEKATVWPTHNSERDLNRHTSCNRGIERSPRGLSPHCPCVDGAGLNGSTTRQLCVQVYRQLHGRYWRASDGRWQMVVANIAVSVGPTLPPCRDSQTAQNDDGKKVDDDPQHPPTTSEDEMGVTKQEGRRSTIAKSSALTAGAQCLSP